MFSWFTMWDMDLISFLPFYFPSFFPLSLPSPFLLSFMYNKVKVYSIWSEIITAISFVSIHCLIYIQKEKCFYLCDDNSYNLVSIQLSYISYGSVNYTSLWGISKTMTTNQSYWIFSYMLITLYILITILVMVTAWGANSGSQPS